MCHLCDAALKSEPTTTTTKRSVIVTNQLGVDEEITFDANIRRLRLVKRNLCSIRGLEQFGELRVVDLSANQFDELPAGLEALDLLEVLNLQQNNIYDADFSHRLSQLRSIVLCDNELNRIVFNPRFDRLRVLQIDNNNLRSVGSLAHLTALRKLRLEENYLKEVPRGLEMLKELIIAYVH